MSPIHVRTLTSTELVSDLTAFGNLLRDSINQGASLGFVAPVTQAVTCDYWLSIRHELDHGWRLLTGAYRGTRLIGSGQLAFPRWSNGTHRAELQKLFVDPTLRAQGIGKRLLDALHDAALQRGRSLLVLHTASEMAAQRFYRNRGYQLAGMIPGYTRGADGRAQPSWTLYRHLEGATSEPSGA